MYSISYANGPHLTADQVMAAYDDIGLEIPSRLAEIVVGGIRYSNEDFDVLSGAMDLLKHYRKDAVSWVATFPKSRNDHSIS